MKTYCVKCKKILRILTQKLLRQKMLDYLCSQNVLSVELKNQGLQKSKKQKDC